MINKKLILSSFIGVACFFTFNAAIAGESSPVDVIGIVQSFMQQQKNAKFEQSLLELDSLPRRDPIVALQTSVKVLTPEETAALTNIKTSIDKKSYNDVVAQVTELLKNAPTFIDLYLDRGEAYFHLMKYEDSLKDAQEFLAKNSTNIDGIVLRSASNLMLGNYKEAITDCDNVLKRESNAKAYTICGFGYGIMNDDIAKANRYADKALKLEPDFKGAMLLKAMVQLQQKKYEEALTLSNKVLAKDPKNPFALYTRGFAYYFKDNYYKAEEDALKSQEIFPEDGYSYFLLGNIYNKTNDKTKSLANYEKAKELFIKYNEPKRVKEIDQLMAEIKNPKK